MADNTTLPGTGETIASEDINGVKYQQLKLIDSTDGSIDPIGVEHNPIQTEDQSLVLLRRMVKILESQSAHDIGQRQKITVDAISGALTLATITTVGTVTTVTNAVPVANIAGYNHMQFIDQARTAYNTGIRAKLV